MRFELFPVGHLFQDGYRIIRGPRGLTHVEPRWKLIAVPRIIIEIGKIAHPMGLGVSIGILEDADPDPPYWSWSWVPVSARELRDHPWLWWSPIVPLPATGFAGICERWTGRRTEIMGFQIRLGRRRWYKHLETWI